MVQKHTKIPVKGDYKRMVIRCVPGFHATIRKTAVDMNVSAEALILTAIKEFLDRQGIKYE